MGSAVVEDVLKRRLLPGECVRRSGQQQGDKRNEQSSGRVHQYAFADPSFNS
jgi:hypothetical protein